MRNDVLGCVLHLVVGNWGKAINVLTNAHYVLRRIVVDSKHAFLFFGASKVDFLLICVYIYLLEEFQGVCIVL